MQCDSRVSTVYLWIFKNGTENNLDHPHSDLNTVADLEPGPDPGPDPDPDLDPGPHSGPDPDPDSDPDPGPNQ